MVTCLKLFTYISLFEERLAAAEVGTRILVLILDLEQLGSLLVGKALRL